MRFHTYSRFSPEMADAVEYLKSQGDFEPALASFCQTLFALNEFVYVE